MARSVAVPPLLERDEERALLLAAWRDARAGRGSLWLLCAEAGGGKSRLADEIAAQGRAFWGAADPVTPPDPFAAVCRALPGFTPAAARAESAARAVTALTEQAGGGPAILVLDDLHFADEGTVAVVVRLAAECRARPWLILAAFRPGEGVRALTAATTELAAQGTARRLDLAPLSREAVGALVGALRGGPAAGDEVERIHADSGGNPWFAGALARGDGALSLARDRVSLRLERLEQATPGARQALRALAPATRPLPHAIVAGLYGEDSPDLRTLLAALRNAGLLHETDDGWQFRHELLRRAVLDDMLAVERRAAHRALAEALGGQRPALIDAAPTLQSPLPTPAEIAMHFAEAHDPRASAWALTAAREAAAVEAHAEAIVQFERALSFDLDPEAQRTALYDAALSAFSAGRFADSLRFADAAAAIAGGRPETLGLIHWTAARAASTIGDHVADERHLAAAERVLEGQPVIFAAVQVATARVARANLGALPGQLERTAARALDLISGMEDRAEAARGEMEIRRAMLGAPLHRGDPAVFRDLEELLRFAETWNLHPGHALAAVTGFHGGATFELFHREADDLYRRSMDGMQQLRFAWEPFVLPYRALGLTQRGRYAEARTLATSLPSPPAGSLQEAVLLLANVLCEARAGTLDRARALLKGSRHVPVFQQTITVDLARLELAGLERDPLLGDMAWWMYQVGDARQYARAAAVAVVALAHAGREAPPPPAWLPPDAPTRIFWAWADGAARDDRPLLRRVSARLAELDLPYESALALRDAGNLGESYRALRMLDVTTAREDVAGRLRAAGRPGPRPTRAGVERDGLTETERAVAQLVAYGARNADVAASLGVSVHTVETHLTHIYQKSGIRGRVALASWWRERGSD